MEILIITIFNIHNFGSVFQAYSLSKYISKCGYDNKIIDYTPEYFRQKKIKTMLGQMLNFKAYTSRTKKYSEFINKYMKLTEEKYYSYKQLKENPPKADIYIAGGDQLWNNYHNCGNDDAYKIQFAKGRKISYGTSMGRENFKKEELLDLKEKINDFKKISVREFSSVSLLNSVGIENVTNVVDPVLLLDKEEYDGFISKPLIEKYIFVYLVKTSNLLNETVKFISEKLGLKVVLYAGLSKKCKCDYLLKDLGPDEVLSYIKHADFVLSESFHASLFSIMFHKQFATILPDKNTNERINDLLRWTNLTSRIITGEECLSNELIEDIDYSETDGIIEKRKEISMEYLNSSLLIE